MRQWGRNCLTLCLAPNWCQVSPGIGVNTSAGFTTGSLGCRTLFLRPRAVPCGKVGCPGALVVGLAIAVVAHI